MPPRFRPLVVIVVVGLFLVGLFGAGCRPSSGKSAAPLAVATDLAAITVTGSPAARPTVQVPVPFTVDATTRRILRTGTGALVKAGQRVSAEYVGVNGTDGKQFDDSWSGSAPSFVLDPKETMPGLVSGLVGVPVGSRVLLAVPPEDGYGVEGLPAAGIGPTDTLVIVIDVLSTRDVLVRAQGTPVAPKAGLPTVRLAANGKPTITVPSGQPPANLVIQPLISGKGAAVAKGQKIIVQYAGVIWATHRVFDSSWDRGTRASFSIGVGKVIAGWDQGLVGQKVGSQVMLVIPPDLGYGAEGSDSAGIKGTDTLVFVIDLLDAA
jgi:peptidylprolyl isomerase